MNIQYFGVIVCFVRTFRYACRGAKQTLDRVQAIGANVLAKP